MFVLYSIAFLIEIPNTVMKFNNSEIFDNFGNIFHMSSAHACCVASFNKLSGMLRTPKFIHINQAIATSLNG